MDYKKEYDDKNIYPNYVHMMVGIETSKAQDDFINDMIDKGWSKEKIIERLNQCYS